MTLAQQISRFAPTPITADVSHLSPNDRKALDKIIDAAQLMDQIYLRQVWSGNIDVLKKLQADTTQTGKERLHYFQINMSPWSALDHDTPFIAGAPEQRPAGANYYPLDMSKEEFTAWLNGLPEKEKESATGFFSTIHRDVNGTLTCVSYNEEYKEWLVPAAKLLKEASALATNKTLKKYLAARADAFRSNDYYASDVAWMELDAPIDVTIGPYETYMDELYNNKAAFEVFVTMRDEAESARLVKFGNYLQDIENNLPLDPKYRNPNLATMSPIRVVDVLYAAGEGNRGVQTAAFNLPNDERVVHEKGSKRVLLKNIQEAKFNKVLLPISRIVLDSTQFGNVSFDAFFTHILCHELMHGLGPHNIMVNGKPTTVRKKLQELYSAIEEAKADITGLFALQYLIDKKILDKKLEQEMYTTYLASMFRSVRFGTNEAHGKGVAIQFNYLTLEGGITIDEASGKFGIDQSKIEDAVAKLTADILTLQAEGSYVKAKAMCDRFGIIHPAMQKALDKLAGIPVDIEPEFTLIKKTANEIR
ncbi:MAG TPA: hypothetical protein VMU30_07545 [Bacteroidota bacterium]|nr:hypothetical protein [Bacteroidota bacterium]